MYPEIRNARKSGYNLYNREAVRAEYQRYPKNKYAAIPLEAKIKQLKETEE